MRLIFLEIFVNEVVKRKFWKALGCVNRFFFPFRFKTGRNKRNREK